MDFVEIYNVCIRKAIIKAAKMIFNSDKICCSCCDFYFGVTFLEYNVELGWVTVFGRANHLSISYEDGR